MDETSRVIVERGPFEMVPHWLLFDVGVGALGVRLYLVLRQHADREGTSFPSRQRLADLLGVSLPTLDKARDQLLAVGAVCMGLRTTESGQQMSSLYHVHWEQRVGCEALNDSVNGGVKNLGREAETAVKKVASGGAGGGKNLASHPKETSIRTHTHITQTQAKDSRAPSAAPPATDPEAVPMLALVTETAESHSDGLELSGGVSGPPATRSPARGGYSPDFEGFWKVYPRKVAKRGAFASWQRVVKQATPEAIIAGAIRYRDDPNREARYTAHPTTWLNQGRWEDETPLPPRTNGTSGERRMSQYADLHAKFAGTDTRKGIGA